MDRNELDLETTILSITTPSIPSWVVYASEEEGGPDENPADLIWTEPVTLWALVEVHLDPEDAETNRFLNKDVPKPRRKVVGMICDQSGPTLVDETEGLFLGYSAKQDIDTKEWARDAQLARKRWARMCGHGPRVASKAETA